MDNLTVTIGVIAFNEQKHINNILDDISKQTYPHNLIDVVLVDGLSTDETKQIMIDWQNSNQGDFARIAVVDNEKRVQPSGWNKVIEHCNTDVLIRIDAHSIIPIDFVENNVQCINSGEDVCGGKRENIIDNDKLSSKILLSAESAMFGSGIAKYRTATKKEYVNTVAHACYKKEVLDNVGDFNEYLLRSEDNDMHYRIRKAGYKICLDPNIQSQYQTRTTVAKMLKQKFGNGKWVGITSGISFSIFSIYHYVPLLFLLGIISTTLCACMGIVFGAIALWLAMPAIIMWSCYGLLMIGMSIIVAIRQKVPVMSISLPILLLLLHLSYGIGTVVGILQMPFVIKKIKKAAV